MNPAQLAKGSRNLKSFSGIKSPKTWKVKPILSIFHLWKVKNFKKKSKKLSFSRNFQMGLFPKTNLLVFCAYLIRIEKRNNFVKENFSNQAFFLWKFNSILQQKRSFLFLPSLFSHALLWEDRMRKKKFRQKWTSLTTFFIEFLLWRFSNVFFSGRHIQDASNIA
jgi:hypothetical protein